jgi:hypothetical protein
MCKLSPGPRCSAHADKTLTVLEARNRRKAVHLRAYEEFYADSLTKPDEEVTPRDQIRREKHERMAAEYEELRVKKAEAEFEYHSCPQGQAELKQELEEAIASNDADAQERLEARLEAGRKYREQNLVNMHELQEIEAEQGLPAAELVAWNKYETAVEKETEASIQLNQAYNQLEEARQEYEQSETEVLNAQEQKFREEREARGETNPPLPSPGDGISDEDPNVFVLHEKSSQPNPNSSPTFAEYIAAEENFQSRPHPTPSSDGEPLADSGKTEENKRPLTVEEQAAEAEAREYARALHEYRKNDRVDTVEEERQQARRRQVQIGLIIAAGSAVLAFTLIRQAATGEKSSLLQYGRSMVMRQASVGGRQMLSKLMEGDKKQLDARERRAEQEAESRASKAREKVYQQAEQEKLVADRQAAREAEREAERQFRRQLLEDQQEAERVRRAEEVAHYERLAAMDLPAPVAEEVAKKARKPAKKS